MVTKKKIAINVTDEHDGTAAASAALARSRTKKSVPVDKVVDEPTKAAAGAEPTAAVSDGSVGSSANVDKAVDKARGAGDAKAGDDKVADAPTEGAKDESAKTNTKFIQKIRQLLPARFRGKEATSLLITNDNLEAHRDAVLAKGRKFKYPAQYSKLRLIITTVVLLVLAIGIFSGWLWHALYKSQASDDFVYSVTKILPLPVAKVGSEPVRYEDYLRRLRANIYYFAHKTDHALSGSELEMHKRQNLDKSEQISYAKSIARNQNISVSHDEVAKEITTMRQHDGATEEELIATLRDYYGWTMGDYEAPLSDQILEKKVAFAVDQEAKKRAESLHKRLEAGEDFATLAAAESDDDSTKENGGAVSVKLDDNRDPTGVVDAVSKLQPGQLSKLIEVSVSDGNSADSSYYYYIAKMNYRDDNNLNYSIIAIKLNKFENDFAKLKKTGQIKEYIPIESADKFQQK